MTDTFDPTKPCRTRDGREVRILCTDAPGERPIIGYMILNDGQIAVNTWLSGGHFMKFGQLVGIDLINTAERVTRWIGVDDDNWKKCIELTFEDGKLIETKIHEA